MPTTKDTPPIEESAVFAWRRDRWIDLGWNTDWADFLADTQMDIGTARNLLDRGATHSQVLRILAGEGPLGADTQFDWERFQKKLDAEIIKSLDKRIEETA